jgi:hypothetical protein
MDELRDKLIDTTDARKASAALAFFRLHLNDRDLLAQLFKIALEGEDAGDAPWAAANVIAEYPVALLRSHENDLRKIAAEPWDYLNQPAKAALAKFSAGTRTYVLTIYWWGDGERSVGGDYAFDAANNADAMAHARRSLAEQISLADQSALRDEEGLLVWENEWPIDQAKDNLPPG